MAKGQSKTNIAKGQSKTKRRVANIAKGQSKTKRRGNAAKLIVWQYTLYTSMG